MTCLIALLLCPLVILTSCFSIELMVGLRPLSRDDLPEAAETTATIVVPAHNEQSVITKSLAALKQASIGRAEILVVADNCTDDTAKLARELGPVVIERSDSQRRGKGFALDAARNHLRSEPPSVVIIIDADCWTDRSSLDLLIRTCVLTKRPCQAIDLQAPSHSASPAIQLSTFAFYVKNVIRQRALQRLAKRTHLLGTGMAFPWAIFERADLASSNIVEDLDMGIKLAASGDGPILVEGAEVWSAAETEKDTLAQRQRWEGGFLGTALRAAPRILGSSLARGDPRGIWAALDLFIPPVALLVLVDSAALIMAALLTSFSRSALWPVELLAASLMVAGLALSLVWIAGGRRFVSVGALGRIPIYVLWKLPLYLRFARRGAPKDWIRTRAG